MSTDTTLPPETPDEATKGGVAPPFRVRVEAAGVTMIYTLADEHLGQVWKTLQDCHALDSAKAQL